MRSQRISKVLSMLCLSVVLVAAGMECPPNDNMNNNDNNNQNNNNNNNNGNDNDNDNNNNTDLTAVITNIAVRHDGRLRAGDDLIAYGTGAVNGVQYIVPSTSPTAGTDFTNSTNFSAKQFEVAGKKLALISNFLVTIHDTTDGSSHTFDEEDIRVSNVPAGDNAQGPLHASGDLVITCSDPTIVNDMVNLKIVDCSQMPPTITGLKNAPDIDGFSAAQIQSARINSTTRKVVGMRNDVFYMWDIDSPDDDPTAFDMAGEGGVGTESFRFDGRYVLFLNGANPAVAKLLDTNTGNVQTISPASARGQLALNGGKMAMFLNRDANDSTSVVFRSAIGNVPGTTVTPAAGDPSPLGFGTTAAITPDGSLYFIAGDDDLNVTSEFIQAGTGGAFAILKNGGNDITGSDVTCSDNTAAFKTGLNNDTKLAYIILP